MRSRVESAIMIRLASLWTANQGEGRSPTVA
jgi:hypothetical protein